MIEFGIETTGTELLHPSKIEVHEQLGETITYKITFSEDICEGDFKLLKDGSLQSGQEISIWVKPEGGLKIYLVKGPIKSHQIKLVHGGQGSQLEVSGSDNSIKMSYKKQSIDYKDVTDQHIIHDIFKRAKFNNTKIALMPFDNPENKHSIIHREDDLSFIKKFASEYGYYFWITYDSEGHETANFDELPLDSAPIKTALALNIEDNNIDDFSINWEIGPVSVIGKQLDLGDKKSLDYTVEKAPQTKLGTETIDKILSGQEHKQEESASHKPADDARRTQRRSEAALNQAEWFLNASCSTSYDRICNIIHPYQIVNVLGIGSRYDGRYLTSGVTHNIDLTTYTMQINLLRNAWDGEAVDLTEIFSKIF
jgi:hypothetical protein